MTQWPITPFVALRVFVQPYLCESPKFIRWRKSHRKSRINKKWHKRYGAIMSTCPGRYYIQENRIVYACPCAMRMIEQEFAKKQA